MMAKKMHILVTGSAGFVGSDIIPKLQSLGHIVTGIDIVEENQSDKAYLHDLTKPINLDNIDERQEYTVFDAIRDNKGKGIKAKDLVKVLQKTI